MELDLIDEYKTQKNQIMRPKMLAVSIDGLVVSSMPLAEEVAFSLVTFAPNFMLKILSVFVASIENLPKVLPNNISDIVVLQWGSG
jgi:hypothetical protein